MSLVSPKVSERQPHSISHLPTIVTPGIAEDNDQTEPRQIHSQLREAVQHQLATPDRNGHLLWTQVSSSEEVTPRNDIRPKVITGGLPTSYEGQGRSSLQPLPPSPLSSQTPPPLDDIIRQWTSEDVECRPSTKDQSSETFKLSSATPGFPSSFSGRKKLTRSNTAKSIVDKGCGFKSHIGDSRMFTHHEKEPMLVEGSNLRESAGETAGASSSRGEGSMQGGRLSLCQTSIIKPNRTSGRSSKLPSWSALSTISALGVTAPTARVKRTPRSSLRDRRNVNLELELPVELHKLTTRTRGFTNTESGAASSIPKDPKLPQLAPDNLSNHGSVFRQPVSPTISKSAEENHRGTKTHGILSDDHIALSRISDKRHLSPGNQAERHISSPPSRKYHQDWNEQEEDPSVQAVGKNRQTGGDHVGQAHGGTMTGFLGRISKRLRDNHDYCWKRPRSDRPESWSVASHIPTSKTRRISASLFSRSVPIHHPSVQPKTKAKSPPTKWNRLAGTRVESSAKQTLNSMPLPPAFVPPGSNRVPTPPTFDTNGAIKGKLADFFFDQGLDASSKKPRPSPEGHWDSDALLMSYSSPDHDLEDEDVEEGPEGPQIPAFAPRSFTVDRNPSYRIPGLISTPRRYPGNSSESSAPGTSSTDTHDIWFRFKKTEMVNESEMTARTLQEADDRRKFEWLIPEHLPNSTLCPLHPSYKGFSEGMCYWHESKASKGTYKADESFPGRRGRRGWEIGIFDGVRRRTPEVKRRRLASLSSP